MVHEEGWSIARTRAVHHGGGREREERRGEGTRSGRKNVGKYEWRGEGRVGKEQSGWKTAAGRECKAVIRVLGVLWGSCSRCWPVTRVERGMASHSHDVQEGTHASLTTLTRDGMFANSILIRHSLL